MSAKNTQFSVAVHILAGLGYRGTKETTSSMIASSVNADPSFVRRVLSKLSKAGLVRTSTGKGGSCALIKSPKEISLLDIYQAVQAPKVFSLHAYEVQKSCPVSCGISSSMGKVLTRVQRTMEEGLKKIKLAEVIHNMK